MTDDCCHVDYCASDFASACGDECALASSDGCAAASSEPPSEVDGYQMSYEYNWVDDGTFSQQSIADTEAELTFEEALVRCAEIASNANAFGWFYQMHSGGY